MADLQITSEQVDGVLVVRMTGEPNMTTVAPVAELFPSILSAKPQKVVFDLRGLEYLSSLVAGRMTATQCFLKREGGQSVIAGPNKLVKDSLLRMKVQMIIPIVDTMEQALAN